MTITYAENEKRHILESSTGYVSTYLKSQLTREEAEQSFKLALKTMVDTPTEQEVVEDTQKEYSEFVELPAIQEEEEAKPVKKNGKK